jgi:tetratricopeptide (TPR) repeat protein
MRARRYAGALGALLLSAALLSPAQAMQAAPTDAATKAAMERRTTARAMLSSALARIANNANDANALLDAGRASTALEDYRAALGFLVRSEQAAPRDGAVKAALGSVMVHMENPTRALDYFGEAQLLGASERLFLADRGLARDLLGQQDAAQRDYQLALSVGSTDELLRRYALSLAIGGEADRAIQMLTPQLRAQDRGAWRLRAMILAIDGRDAEATEIVNATMPAALAQNILPYLVQMDRLNPAQQAAAAHFGRFPSGELGPKRKPVQMAAAAPPPAPAAPTLDKRRPTTDRGRPRGTVLPAPVATPPVVVRRAASSPPAAQPPVAKPVTATPAPTPAAMPTPSLGTQPVLAPKPVSTSTTTASAAGTLGPGFSIDAIGRPAEASPKLPPPPPSSSALPVPVRSAAPLASLAAIASSIEIPPEELTRPANAIGVDTLVKLQEDRRRAEAAEAAKREKDAAAAKVKAEADAKAKEEAAKKKANPARLWVQIATGANPKALAFDYNRFAKKSPDLFKGKAVATAEWGRTRRLLVGPFKDNKTAQDWLGSYKKGGGDGFLFNSEAGESVDPVK